MIHGIPIVRRCPVCGNGILVSHAGRNECQFVECSREAAVYISQEEINAELVPALLKQIEGYKKSLNYRVSKFVLPKIQRLNNCFIAVPQPYELVK
jgi:hypothetical protein